MAHAPPPEEIFERDTAGRVWRHVSAGPLRGPPAFVFGEGEARTQDALRAAWDRAWLRGALPVQESPRRGSRAPLRVVDLFSGCGAMSLGMKMVSEALGLEFQPAIAADMVRAALDVYRHNLKPALAFNQDLSAAIKYRKGSNGITGVQIRSRSFAKAARRIDVLIGGPPCQGHSDLNNHSRRDDPKNSLYLIMPAVALALEPTIVIVENVPAVVHDRSGVVATTVATLAGAGYQVTLGTIPVVEVGVAQRRKRHFLVAVRGRRVDFGATVSALRTAPRPVSWAIDDLQNVSQTGMFDAASKQNVHNRDRIGWLFANEAYDLPNERRPSCHRDKEHSYVSMYGRMRWDEPAQTVTSGFGSPGQGRYVHATQPRTLTPHEAARLQFFPDSFRFEELPRSLKRTEMAVMIGNAVPPKASYVLGLAALAAAGDRLTG